MNQKSVLKAVGIFTFVTFILSIIPVTSWAQTIEDIAGEWKFIVDSYGLQLGTAQTVFTKKPDGTYEGTWTNHHGENKLSEIKFEKGKLSFIIEAELRITFKGAMTGGTIMGDLLTGKEWGGISASGTRIITKDLYIGEWEFKIKLPEQQILPCKAVFTKKVDGTLIGKWTVRERETELNKVKFEKEKINFECRIPFPDRELSMTFEGQLRGDKIFGYFTPPQGNRIFATGTWVTPTLSIIGEWEITMISGESEISSTLLFYQKSDGILAGKWISQKGESELSGVKFENGKLTFTQKRTVREKELISTFEGAVKNEILRGYMKMEVTGKKKK